MDIKILVAAHKKYWMPDDSVYLPIQVGAALHPHWDMFWIIREIIFRPKIQITVN